MHFGQALLFITFCEFARFLNICILEIASYNGETDITKIINVLKARPEIVFFYLTHSLQKKHIDYHYYNLK